MLRNIMANPDKEVKQNVKKKKKKKNGPPSLIRHLGFRNFVS